MTNEPFLICFIGGPGYGKTYLAREIAKATGFPVISNDKIRRKLENEGQNWLDQERVHKIAYDQARELLSKGKSIIIDANALRKWREIEALGARCYFVNLVCAENVILARLRKRDDVLRQSGDTGDSVATVDAYRNYQTEIKSLRFPEDKVFSEIRTDQDLAPQIEEFMAKIRGKA